LDGAKETWALEHNKTGAVSVAESDVAPYLGVPSHTGQVQPVAGERYFLKKLNESPEAQLTRKLAGHPKGTIFRFGTNGNIETILLGMAH
jgi:hypothetical protein